MNQGVGLEVAFGDEGFSAIFEVACERAVSSVSPHVSLQIPCFIEFSDTVAERAEE